MEIERQINKVLAGIRAMNHKPDALLFIDSTDQTYDEDYLSDIPVFHTEYIHTDNETESSFIPIWKHEYEGMWADIIKFYRTFEEEE
jgi:ribosomal protein S2